MVFSSISFIFYFLPVFLLGYYAGGCWIGLLLAGSAAFYVWGEGPYVFLLLALIGLNYAGSRWLSGQDDDRRRRMALAGLIVVDLSVLGWFKYAGFLAANLDRLLPGAPIR
jgi:alginate O-acetyltransferase complex protein AlgI